MELAATALGSRYAVPDIVTGALVLAVVTSLPNAVSAVYLAMRGRGAAVLSTALNSNAINVVAGLLIPASITGLGPASGQDVLVAAWYAGLTVLALAFAYRGRGLGRLPGALIIAGYLAFVAALGCHRRARRGAPGCRRRARRCHRRLRGSAAGLAGCAPAARRAGRPARLVAAGIPAARLEHRQALGAQPARVPGGRGLRCRVRAAPDPDRPAGLRAVLRAADRPVAADCRLRGIRRRARDRARRPGPDLRDPRPSTRSSPRSRWPARYPPPAPRYSSAAIADSAVGTGRRQAWRGRDGPQPGDMRGPLAG